ncbi:MAG: YlxR family protein [Acidimicrobiales bacterium]
MADPRRTCIGCRRTAAADELVRVVATAEGRLAVGRSAPGRGAWLCADSPTCVAKAVRRRAFGRALHREVGEAAVAELARALPGDATERARIEGCGIRSRKD